MMFQTSHVSIEYLFPIRLTPREQRPIFFSRCHDFYRVVLWVRYVSEMDQSPPEFQNPVVQAPKTLLLLKMAPSCLFSTVLPRKLIEKASHCHFLSVVSRQGECHCSEWWQADWARCPNVWSVSLQIPSLQLR